MTTRIQNWHPAAESYPMMGEEEFQRLMDSILRQGILKPVEIYMGTAFPEYAGFGIDGRNRAKAASEIGIDFPVRELSDSDFIGSLTDYITSVNSVRRHEDAGMRAAIAVGLEECYATEAKERKRANGGDKKSVNAMRQRLEIPAKSDLEKIPGPILEQGNSRDKAAHVCNVNSRYVQDAKKLSQEAPALFEKLKVGAIKLPVAMAALKRKGVDSEAWAKLLSGSISIEDFRARCKRKDNSPQRSSRVHGDKRRPDEASQQPQVHKPQTDAKPKSVAWIENEHETTDAEFLADLREQARRIFGEVPAVEGKPAEVAKRTDCFGRPIPASIVNVFNDAEILQGHLDSLRKLITEIHQLQLVQTPKHFPGDYRRLIGWVDSYQQQLDGGCPKCVCPQCQGTGKSGDRMQPICCVCKGIGWIGNFDFERLRPELRQAAESYRAAG